ncbi:MAG TPA: N-acetyltransferase [Caulifigura sp.]|nr:N-acetyltransferase [Caulifigura sp.]
MPAMLSFSEEAATDALAIDEIVAAAFGQRGEADLVKSLRNNGGLLFSGVARLDGDVVAHIAYSPVSIGGLTSDPPALALAPVAVSPTHQRKDYGSSLIRWSLEQLAGRGFPAVIVLGEPGFYSRFGFQPAATWDITCPYDVPGEYFMGLELAVGTLVGQSGVLGYRPEFANVS